MINVRSIAKTIAEATATRAGPSTDPPFKRVEAMLGRRLTPREHESFEIAWARVVDSWFDTHPAPR